MIRLLVFLSIILVASSAEAASLLASIPIGLGGGGPGTNASVSRIAFEFGYGTAPMILTGPPCDVPRIGCEGIPVPQLHDGAVFDFNSSNSLAFNSVVTRMSNGTSEQMWAVNLLYNSADSLLQAGGGGAPEKTWLKGNPDLKGTAIEFVRLHVNRFAFLDNVCCGGGIDYESDLTWEVYGSFPTPTHLASWGSLKAAYR